MTPSKPQNPPDGDNNPPDQRSTGQIPESERRRGPRAGGHGSYKLGGEPAIGHSWAEAPAPPGRYVPPPPGAPVNPLHKTPLSRYDDGVPHDPHTPGDLLHNEEVDHEHADINVRGVVASAIVLVVVGLISQVIIWVLFGVLEKQAAANDPQVSPLAATPATMPRSQVGTPVFAPESVGGPQL